MMFRHRIFIYKNRARAAAMLLALTVLLSLIPLALPRFMPEGTKSGSEAESFEYTNNDFDGVKSDATVAFMTTVSQTVTTPDVESLKLLETSSNMKSVDQSKVLEVKLETGNETVRQLWDASSPWPVFSSNGSSTARLLDVIAAPETPNLPVERGIVPPVENLLVNNANGDSGNKSVEEGDNREHGTASYKPWSGPWWPMKNGGLNVPLGKYDKITGHAAVAWENQHNLAGNFRELPGWFGFCHAWAAASILEKEPQQVRTVSIVYQRQGHGVFGIRLQESENRFLVAIREGCESPDKSRRFSKTCFRFSGRCAK